MAVAAITAWHSLKLRKSSLFRALSLSFSLSRSLNSSAMPSNLTSPPLARLPSTAGSQQFPMCLKLPRTPIVTPLELSPQTAHRLDPSCFHLPPLSIRCSPYFLSRLVGFAGFARLFAACTRFNSRVSPSGLAHVRPAIQLLPLGTSQRSQHSHRRHAARGCSSSSSFSFHPLTREEEIIGEGSVACGAE
jgi:hypothetical protein